MDFYRTQTGFVFILCYILEFADSFWFLSHLPVAGLSTTAHRLLACEHIPGLLASQLHLCAQQPEIMWSIGEGVRAGLDECQNQFKSQRWNCSTIHIDNQAGKHQPTGTLDKLTLKVGTREGAFVQAITSAGVVFAIGRACASGELGSCSCEADNRLRARDAVDRDFQWTGCEAHMIRYAVRMARKFVDAGERGAGNAAVKDDRAPALINLHNNRAGRKAVQGNLIKECKCHGVSGSCTVKTCWRAIPGFGQVGQILRRKYDHARKVTLNDTEENWKTIYSNPLDRPLKKTDLVFYEKSPDYCSTNHWQGSVGTGGRVCSLNSTAPDSCEIMCCGRGYDRRTITHIKKCQCKFQWCCEVKCSQCETTVEEYICKPDSVVRKPLIYGQNHERERSQAKRRFRHHHSNTTFLSVQNTTHHS
ncbi:protein Wnt-2-like [Paramacrobiotus metropolitanus]|uniref:protein Wnt-2-like n=1 Tax=Paramacrobiotus metropolitanus TaxID=2943436 RepID=UPI002445653E|nr:protein Wnt-2-like [Paramacrobiotus metropolitanus]